MSATQSLTTRGFNVQPAPHKTVGGIGSLSYSAGHDRCLAGVCNAF